MRTLTLIFIFTEVIILKRKPWIFFVCKNCFEEISEVFHNDVISGLRVNKIFCNFAEGTCQNIRQI